MLYILILFLNLFVFINGTCPNGSVPHKTQCLYFQATKSEYFVAESVCSDLGGHLVSIHRLDDNMVISQLAGARFTESSESDFWFGATDVYSPSKWSWLDNSSLDFTNWDKGQPADTDGSDCGALIMRGGKWKADDCYNDKPYVCSIPMVAATEVATTTTTTTASKSKACQIDWTYSNVTGYCYIVLKNENWFNAEEMCKADNAHLASIHSYEENLFIAGLASYSHDTNCNGLGEAWVGGFTEDDNARWKWNDGTPVDYTYWGSGNPDNPGSENCLEIFLSSIQTRDCNYETGQWNNLRCDGTIGRYVCKKLPF